MRHLLIITFCFLCLTSFAQETYLRTGIEGYYEGAIIKGNSVALLTAEIYQENDSFFIHSNVKEWTYYSGKVSVVKVKDNVVQFKTYFGDAQVAFDSVYSEMAGNIIDAKPSLNIHLKKVRKPVRPKIETHEFVVKNDGVSLQANLLLPDGFKRPLACAIFVDGRGCSDRLQQVQKAKVLASYGIATVVFDKRGAAGTDFDCGLTTINMHTDDLVKVIELVASMEEIDADKIGLIGGSYGGWVAPRAAARSNQKVAFMISIVGPATSIKQQQLDNAVYFTKQQLNGDEDIIKQIQEYLLAEYEIGDDQKTFERLNAYLEDARKNKWINILEESDIANSASEVEQLWVRRNQYDPAEDLKQFKGPFLSILGEVDDVVPWKENSTRFHQLFQEAGKTNYRIVVLPAAPHWLEHVDLDREIEVDSMFNDISGYFKFDRVAAGLMNEQLDFLRGFGFLKIE